MGTISDDTIRRAREELARLAREPALDDPAARDRLRQLLGEVAAAGEARPVTASTRRAEMRTTAQGDGDHGDDDGALE